MTQLALALPTSITNRQLKWQNFKSSKTVCWKSYDAILYLFFFFTELHANKYCIIYTIFLAKLFFIQKKQNQIDIF